MEIDITIKNYRCFPDSLPVRLSLRPGFTALVGVNNSGKSSLLRFFFEFRPLFEALSGSTTALLAALRNQRQNLGHPPQILDVEEVFSNENKRNLSVDVSFRNPDSHARTDLPLNPIRATLTIHREPYSWNLELFSAGGKVGGEENVEFQWVGEHLQRPNGQVIADFSNLFAAFRLLKSTLYIGPFRNAINIGASQNYFDIPTGQAFINAWKEYKAGNRKRQNEAAARLTDQIRHIFAFKDFQIDASADNQTLAVIINDKPYKLHEFGSGLTQFILVLAAAAMKEPTPSYMLIDEPELSLHPTLQLDFLTTLGSYATEGVIFGTQCYGLARAVGDRIYYLQKNDEGASEVRDLETTPHLSVLLGELSFSGYRELGFDQILLVEGTTDVTAIQQFLRLYDKDHKIVLLPLGGSGMINGNAEPSLEEIKRISENVSALIDSELENADDKLSLNRREFFEVCERAKVKCHVLERRAIENYFPEQAVKAIKGEKYRALAPYEVLCQVSPAWAKAENWKIAREMNRAELDQTDLGKFLGAL